MNLSLDGSPEAFSYIRTWKWGWGHIKLKKKKMKKTMKKTMKQTMKKKKYLQNNLNASPSSRSSSPWCNSPG